MVVAATIQGTIQSDSACERTDSRGPTGLLQLLAVLSSSSSPRLTCALMSVTGRMGLFYLEPDRLQYRLIAVPIRLGSGAVFETGAPEPLFAFRGLGMVPQANAFAYSVAAGGQRFLVRTQVNTDEPTLNVIVNWEKAAPAKER